MRRREFLGSTPLLFLSARFADACASEQQTAIRGQDLREELSADETAIVNKSVMAKGIGDLFGKGFS